MRLAAKGWHLGVLIWAREHRCLWGMRRPLLLRGRERAPGDAAVDAGARMSVGCVELVHSLL